MTDREPITELDPRFSSAGATPTSWSEGCERLEEAEVYWISTVRPGGRPHVTPLLGVWVDGALHFCTGPDERKAKNLAHNPRRAHQEQREPPAVHGTPLPAGSRFGFDHVPLGHSISSLSSSGLLNVRVVIGQRRTAPLTHSEDIWVEMSIR